MKVKNSSVQFKTFTNTRVQAPIDPKTIPYWRLYTTKYDTVQEEQGRQLRIPGVFSYDEVIRYLEASPIKRSLIAYPRLSSKERSIYTYKYYCKDHVAIVDKYSGKILAGTLFGSIFITEQAQDQHPDAYWIKKLQKLTDGGTL